MISREKDMKGLPKIERQRIDIELAIRLVIETMKQCNRRIEEKLHAMEKELEELRKFKEERTKRSHKR